METSLRCFFHLINGDEVLRDETGVEVESATEARTEALKVIDELRREDRRIQQSWNGWRLRIVDETDRVLATIRLNAVSHPVSGRSYDVAPPPHNQNLRDRGDPE